MLIAAIEPLPDAALHHPEAALHLPFAAAASLAQRQAFPRCSRIVARPAASFSAQTAASLHPSATLPPAAPPRRPGQQHLPDGSPPLRTGQPLRRSAPASNKPHSTEKSTPVWLAIWRIWAGFANSQLLSAAFRSIYLYLDGPIPLAATLGCCSNRRKSVGPSAPIAYATSVSPPNEAAAWPRRRCWMQDEAAV